MATKKKTKMTKKGRDFVSQEISDLMTSGPSKGPQKGKPMPQKQAVAVALSVARRKGFKAPKNPNESDNHGRGSIFDQILSEKELTTRGRKQIDPDNFAIPEVAPGSGSYPIHDLAHARNALSRVAAHGTADEQKRVKAAVYKKYPALKERSEQHESSSIFDGLVRPIPSAFDAIVSESRGSLFDEFVDKNVDESEADFLEKTARTLSLVEGLSSICSQIKGGE